LCWLALPLSVLAARQLFRKAHRPQQLTAAIKLTILAMLLHGGLLALVLSLSRGIA
jgi:1,4-dihydroxy-2-naphthoate octaprenyltransferase